MSEMQESTKEVTGYSCKWGGDGGWGGEDRLS